MLAKFFCTAFALALTASAAVAQCGAIPNTLTNGQNADATQVMTNFNHLRDCINNAPPPSGIDDVTRWNILLNTASLAKLNSGYVRNINVFADGYKASDGVNSALSSSYSVDTTNGRVSPTASGGTDITTTGGAISGGDLGGNTKDKAFDNNNATTWYSSQTGAGVNGVAYIGQDFGTGVTKDVIQFVIRQDTGNGNAITSAKIQYSDNGSSWTDVQTISLASGGGVDQTFNFSSVGSHRYWRLLANTAAGASAAWGIQEMQMSEPGSTGNMTLVTTSQTADSTVSSGRVLMEFNPVDSITLNTDLTVEVTCNNGTNWTSATLSTVGTAQAGRKIAETADTVCGTSGTSFAARIKTQNLKNVQIYKTAISVH
ncbi:MAG: discoidin domain-containing protein [Xanthobacteraceae bacterium]|nr:discoidin domain-containing protein [Xanthobacteraceae bacterium]